MNKIRKSNSKYICAEKEKIKEFIKKEGFIFKDSVVQKDEYFIDLNSKMLKNESCIRVRTIKDKNIILSFEGNVENLSQISIKDSRNVFCSTSTRFRQVVSSDNQISGGTLSAPIGCSPRDRGRLRAVGWGLNKLLSFIHSEVNNL